MLILRRERGFVNMKIGDIVTLTSQAMGCEKEKKGTVIAEIPSGESAMLKVPKGTKTSHIKLGSDKSVHDRVLVAVPA